MNGPSPEAVQAVWLASLGIFFVVLVVVALLLTLIVSTARSILGGVEAIWNTGQRIANNTVHIALLKDTNRVARRPESEEDQRQRRRRPHHPAPHPLSHVQPPRPGTRPGPGDGWCGETGNVTGGWEESGR